jgi:hypothetical protein
MLLEIIYDKKLQTSKKCLLPNIFNFIKQIYKLSIISYNKICN